MKQPETLDVFLFGQQGRQTAVIMMSPYSKLGDISNSYFSHLDPEFCDRDRAIDAVIDFLHLLEKLPSAPEGTTENLQWVCRDNGDRIHLVSLEDGTEALLADFLCKSYNVTHEVISDHDRDDWHPSQLALGMGIDFMHWLNEQLPAVVAEEAAKAAAKTFQESQLAKLPQTAEDATYFLATTSDQLKKIHFDKVEAFGTKAPLLDVFNAKGEHVGSFRYVSAGELPQLPADFEGYTPNVKP